MLNCSSVSSPWWWRFCRPPQRPAPPPWHSWWGRPPSPWAPSPAWLSSWRGRCGLTEPCLLCNIYSSNKHQLCSISLRCCCYAAMWVVTGIRTPGRGSPEGRGRSWAAAGPRQLPTSISPSQHNYNQLQYVTHCTAPCSAACGLLHVFYQPFCQEDALYC